MPFSFSKVSSNRLFFPLKIMFQTQQGLTDIMQSSKAVFTSNTNKSQSFWILYWISWCSFLYVVAQNRWSVIWVTASRIYPKKIVSQLRFHSSSYTWLSKKKKKKNCDSELIVSGPLLLQDRCHKEPTFEDSKCRWGSVRKFTRFITDSGRSIQRYGG